MRAADTILKIIYHPEDAPSGVFIECPDLPLGPGDLDQPDDGLPEDGDGFAVDTWQVEGEDRWFAAGYFGVAMPPALIGEGDTELAAVVDFRSRLLEVLRGDLADLFAAWSKAAGEGEMEPQDNGGLDFDELEVVAPIMGLVAKLMRAQAKLRELDGPTLTVTVGGKLIEMPEGER